MSYRPLLLFRFTFVAGVAACLFALSRPAFAQEDYDPEIAEASRDAELALKGFVIPDGMTGSLLAAEPLLANPVVFHVTDDGRVYVCETFRQEAGVEDNRSHMDWLENDLRLETVEERLAMFKRYLGQDVEKYASEHDRIRLLNDTDGDGTFDEDTVFAEGFNDILDGTGAGVLEVDGKVYYTCIPKLWMLEDADGDGRADNADAMHHGYGVRVAFRGHDMHGLILGPDGRLYFSIGDRGFNVITKEGTRLKMVDTGAVFRCDLDGTNLEVFAYGLRNPQELAFDDHGNLFTGDNNSDGGDLARWVYVVQDGDSGWRMYYQYLEDRGPWIRERMFYPYRLDEETAVVQPAYIVPPIANVGDGPSGLTYYPGLGLSERYRNHFFLADFRGQASNSGVRSFSVKPIGATFELTDSHQFLWSILCTDVDFAPDGSLYVTDWVNGWIGEGKGRLYRFADDGHVSDVAAANVPELLAGGVKAASIEHQFALLSHADRRVRQQAQFALAKNAADDEELRIQLSAAALRPDDDVTARHALWACWQIGLTSEDNGHWAAGVMATALKQQSRELQAQAVKVLTDLVDRHGIDTVLEGDSRESLRKLLRQSTSGDDRRLAGFCATALGTIGRSEDATALLSLLDRNANEDPVVRHQAMMGLTQLEERSPGLLTSISKTSGDAGRLGIVLALRRLEDPAIGNFLNDSNPDVAIEAARAINDVPIEAGQGRLAELAARPGLRSPMLRRVLNANYRIGTAANAEAVAKVAANELLDDAVRRLAVNMLKTWNDTQNLDTVTGRWRPLPVRDVEGLAEAVEPHVPAMLTGSEKLREAAIEVAAVLGVKEIVPALDRMLRDKNSVEAVRVASFNALAKLSDNVEDLLNRGRDDSSEAIRIAALELLAGRRPEFAVSAISDVLASGSVKAQQAGIRLLGEIRQRSKQPGVLKSTEIALLDTFRSLHAGSLPQPLTLDLLLAAESKATDSLQKEVDDFRALQQSAGTQLAMWSECLEGGDAARGEQIFFGRAAASCRRCHKVNGNGSDVGPDLSEVAKENDRAYLLEAIVDPNAKIAKGFETVIVVTIEGKVLTGIVKEETHEVVRLMTAEGAMLSVAVDDIEERAKGLSGMPSDLVKSLTRSDVRDLVEYLACLKEAVGTEHGESK